jgi:hypothetical protein
MLNRPFWLSRLTDAVRERSASSASRHHDVR